MPWRPKTRQGRQQRRMERRGTAHERGYDKAWRELRKRRLKHDGFQCQRCGDFGNYSWPVDHIIPFDGPDDPLRLDFDNLQTLCPTCHGRKTATEDGRKENR